MTLLPLLRDGYAVSMCACWLLGEMRLCSLVLKLVDLSLPNGEPSKQPIGSIRYGVGIVLVRMNYCLVIDCSLLLFSNSPIFLNYLTLIHLPLVCASKVGSLC